MLESGKMICPTAGALTTLVMEIKHKERFSMVLLMAKDFNFAGATGQLLSAKISLSASIRTIWCDKTEPSLNYGDRILSENARGNLTKDGLFMTVFTLSTEIDLYPRVEPLEIRPF